MDDQKSYVSEGFDEKNEITFLAFSFLKTLQVNAESLIHMEGFFPTKDIQIPPSRLRMAIFT